MNGITQLNGIALGCIGDDYTGSSDLANALTRAGLRTLQTIGVPAADIDLGNFDAVVIAFKSRAAEPAAAIACARAARDWLKAHGADHILFKICSTFDSTDRGNIGPVMDALRGDVGDSAGNSAGDGAGGLVLVNSSFPQAERTIYRGHLFVGDVLLSDSPLKDHPLNPMTDPDLVRVLSRQSNMNIGLIPLAVVDQGVEAVRQRMTDLAAQGYGAAITDTVLDRNLDIVGAAALASGLSVGASGLGIGLARALIANGLISRAGHAGHAPIGGPVAALAGSCSQATLEQVEHARKWGAVMQLDTELLIEQSPQVAADAALTWAAERLADGPVLIASSAHPQAVRQLQARFGEDQAGRQIEETMARIAAGLYDAGVRRLIVAGGETSGAVVDRLGLSQFAVGDEIAPGVPVLRTLDAGREPMVLALKSGNFGGPDFFRDAHDLMP